MYKTKQDYNINKAKSFFLGVLITVGTGVAMIFGTGCHHEDPVTPPTPKPDPTDTIVIPTKEKTFNWDWRFDTTWTPAFDSLKKYVDDPTYKYIIMNMVNKRMDDPEYDGFGMEGSPCTGIPARFFRHGRDSVYSVADKCNGKFRMSGIVNVSDVIPDSIQSGYGIFERDSVDLTKMCVYIRNVSREYSNN